MNLPIDLALGKPVDEMTNSTTDYVIQLETNLTQIHEIARAHLNQASLNMKRIYDKGKHVIEYSLGDAVWYYHPRRQRNLSPKLQNPWVGPYLITQKYGEVLYEIRLKPSLKGQIVHHDKLKPYKGENKPTWYDNLMSSD